MTCHRSRPRQNFPLATNSSTARLGRDRAKNHVYKFISHKICSEVESCLVVLEFEDLKGFDDLGQLEIQRSHGAFPKVRWNCAGNTSRNRNWYRTTGESLGIMYHPASQVRWNESAVGVRPLDFGGRLIFVIDRTNVMYLESTMVQRSLVCATQPCCTS